MKKTFHMSPEDIERLDLLFALRVMELLDDARAGGVLNNWEYDFIGTMRAMWVESGKMPSAKQETLLLELAIKLVLWAETGRPSLRASRSYFDGLIDCYGLNHSDDEPPEDEPPDDDPNRYRTT